MAASSRYMMVNDIQRETSAVSRPERGAAIMLSDRFTPLEGTKLPMDMRGRRLARPPPRGTEFDRGTGVTIHSR